MDMTVALLAAGLVALVVGAELITRAGTAFAAKLGIPPIVIGLTIVAVGTSAPELAVGIEAALRGADELAVGNIAGTNTVNLLLILGLSALILPLPLRLQTLRLDLPAMVAAALAMMWTAWDGTITRTEGAILVGFGVLYTAAVVLASLRERHAIRAEFAEEYGEDAVDGKGGRAGLKSFLALVVGMAIIVVGADWLVRAASDLARAWGVSEAFIGLTVVAIGTSAPELATTVISTLRNERDIAIGNLLGSSVYNIVFILGITCLVPADGISVSRELIMVDIPVMTAAALLCAPVFVSGRRVSRGEALLFVAAYSAYLAYLITMRV